MSLYLWSKMTGSEHTLAPHPLRDRQPPDVWKAWRLSDYSFYARMRQPATRLHDIALQKLLDRYARELADHIDATGNADLTVAALPASADQKGVITPAESC